VDDTVLTLLKPRQHPPLLDFDDWRERLWRVVGLSLRFMLSIRVGGGNER